MGTDLMSASFWGDWVMRQSIPTVLLLLLLLALWKVARFMAPKVTAVFDAHLAFLSKTHATIKGLEGKVDENVSVVRENTRSIEELVKEVRTLAREHYSRARREPDERVRGS